MSNLVVYQSRPYNKAIAARAPLVEILGTSTSNGAWRMSAGINKKPASQFNSAPAISLVTHGGFFLPIGAFTSVEA